MKFLVSFLIDKCRTFGRFYLLLVFSLSKELAIKSRHVFLGVAVFGVRSLLYKAVELPVHIPSGLNNYVLDRLWHKPACGQLPDS